MKKILFFCLALTFVLLPIRMVRADDMNTVSVTEGGGALDLITGESAQLQVPLQIQYEGTDYTVSSYTFSSDNDEVATVDASGTVKAVHMGTTRIAVQIKTKWTESQDWDDDSDDWDDSDYYEYLDYKNNAYINDYEYTLFWAYYDVTVMPDLSRVKINKTSQTSYQTSAYGYMQYTFKLKSAEPLSEDWDMLVLSCESSNPDVSVYGSLQDNVLTITTYNTGKTTVTVSLNDQKMFKLKLHTILLSMKDKSALMVPGQKKQLRVTGGNQASIKWSSSNSSVVSVSSSGKLTARKNGNALIKAKIGDCMLGCAVSVVSASRKKAINEGTYIGTHWTYSQPRRMEKKFYDCSSLVWKSYKKGGIYIGNKYYAPVAADIGKWCADKKKLVKGGLSQRNVDRMLINAGDLMFETGGNNGRYKGIYHVEMITGYICEGFDDNGKPYLTLKWAARPDGYYFPDGQMVGRP